MIRLEMINCKVAKILTLIYKYQYLTGEEKLPPDQRKMIEPVKFI